MLKHKIYSYFEKRIKILTVLCTLVFFVSQLFGRQHWFIELFTHFSCQYGFFLILAYFFLRNASKIWRYMSLLLGLAIIAWSLLPPLPYFSGAGKHQFVFSAFEISSEVNKNKKEDDNLAIIMANVNINHANPEKHLQSLIKFHPDMLLLPEAGGIWKKSLTVLNSHPYRCGHDENSPFALQILSKKPMSCDIQFIATLPYARIDIAGHIIYAVHPPPPIGRLALTRNLYLKNVAQRIKTETQPTLMTGDFNLTPFSPIYRDFIAQTKLNPSTQKYNPTWSIAPFAIPIDYILHKNLSEKTLLTIKKLPKYGSDHHALLIQLTDKN